MSSPRAPLHTHTHTPNACAPYTDPAPAPHSLVDEINHKVVTDKGLSPTSSTILGPFWSPETPFRDLGASVIQDYPPGGEVTYFHGVVRDVDTGVGIPGAVFDMWQASTNGKYDVFDPENQTRHNLRGKFRTDDQGRFDFYCLKPTEYAIDTSGPSAELLRIMGRHPNRPAHIHIMVRTDLARLCCWADVLMSWFLCRSHTRITSASRRSFTPATTRGWRLTLRARSRMISC